MSRTFDSRLGDVGALVRLARRLTPFDDQPETGFDHVHRQRTLLAVFCRLLGEHLGKRPAKHNGGFTPRPSPNPGMTPRMRQTLDLLLAGEGEKQIAQKLGLSKHTVHDYVKAVYRKFGVSSRAELLSLWVERGE